MTEYDMTLVTFRLQRTMEKVYMIRCHDWVDVASKQKSDDTNYYEKPIVRRIEKRAGESSNDET